MCEKSLKFIKWREILSNFKKCRVIPLKLRNWLKKAVKIQKMVEKIVRIKKKAGEPLNFKKRQEKSLNWKKTLTEIEIGIVTMAEKLKKLRKNH